MNYRSHPSSGRAGRPGIPSRPVASAVSGGMRSTKADTPAPSLAAPQGHAVCEELQPHPDLRGVRLHRAHLLRDRAHDLQVRRDPPVVVVRHLDLLHRADAINRIAAVVSRRAAELLQRGRDVRNMRMRGRRRHAGEG